MVFVELMMSAIALVDMGAPNLGVDILLDIGDGSGQRVALEGIAVQRCGVLSGRLTWWTCTRRIGRLLYSTSASRIARLHNDSRCLHLKAFVGQIGLVSRR